MAVGASITAASLVGKLASKVSLQTIELRPSPFVSLPSSSTSSWLPALSSDACDILLRTAKYEQATTFKGASLSKPISLLASSDPQVLGSLIASDSFKALLSYPIAFHIATNSDHAPIHVLRSSGVVVLYSSSGEEAQKSVYLASRLAVAASRPVVHFFDADENARDISSTLPASEIFLAHGTKLNGFNASTNGHANGHTNGDVEMSGANGDNTTGNPDEDNLPSFHHSLESALEETYARAEQHKLDLKPLRYTGPQTPSKLIVALGNAAYTNSLYAALNSTDIGLLKVSLLRPFNTTQLLASIPESVSSVIVLEQAYARTTKWAPFYLDVLSAFHAPQQQDPIKPARTNTPVISSAILGAVGTHTAPESAKIIEGLFSKPKTQATVVGQLPSSPSYPHGELSVPKHEESYHKLLAQTFTDRLQVLNDLKSPSPSLAVGKFLASKREQGKANWVIGSDAWSYDTGLNGLQTLLSTGIDCNILIVDTSPYPAPPNRQRKKDVGLYALNYGNAYVASVAIYGNYSQTVQALLEAEKFKGPSVVMAYLPGGDDDSLPALEVLKTTKKAMETGYWGLYRFDPTKPEAQAFSLDSVRIKKDLSDFLDRQNLLTQMSNRLPSYDIPAKSLGTKALEERQSKAKQAFERLSGALASGPSVLVLYASDGGTAEKLARKFVGRATARGVNARAVVMDEFAGENFETLREQKEDNIILMSSVAGQGEFPLNGRQFWKTLQATQAGGENSPNGSDGAWALIKFAVFGLGDSHYWPRPEDAGYYNKPAKDLDKKLGQDLSLNRLVDEVGLGDDQDSDGYMTGYKIWEGKVWAALGVANVEVTEAEPEPITNEHIKIASNYLRGTIKEGLADTSTGCISESDGQLTKFHGIYGQDDRDIREERQAQGLEPAYSFMVRVRMPAGVCSPEQWLQIDNISDTRGNHTFKLTTRQTFQFHGIIKANLKPAIQEINKAMLDTIAACGDVNRNVMCSSNPTLGPVHAEVAEYAKRISEHLMPRTNAYAEIWLDKKMVAGDAVKDFEPLYGEYYLPRKFKIAIAVPPYNDTDCFAHDIGLIAIESPDGHLQGFNVAVGGGMGVTHSMKKTYPRLGSVIGYASVDKIVDVCEKVMLVQRDHGDRTNRKHARLKYTVDDMTVEGFKQAVEDRLNFKLEAQRPYTFESNTDTFGWQTGHDGKKHFTCFIENGRVCDEPGKEFKTALKEIAKVHKGTFRLTANQHLTISEIPPEEVATIDNLLRKYKLDNVDFSGLRLSSSACVAFPTCGLAMAESERYLPTLIDKVEKIMEESGLRNNSIVMRMTGCPNGCARPWLAEASFVGKSAGQYMMMLGGGYHGQRLSKPFRESVNEAEILQILGGLIPNYAKTRLDGEHFGDWCIRTGVIAETTEGKAFYDNSVMADVKV